MRVASAVVSLVLFLVCIVLESEFKDIADLSFAAGSASLTQGGAWLGLLAFAFHVWFFATAVTAMVHFIGCLPFAWSKRAADNPLPAMSYRSISISGWWSRGLLICLVILNEYQPGLSVVAWATVLGLVALVEHRLFKGKAMWHRLPGFFAGAVTFSFVLLSWVLFRSANLDHAMHYYGALAGHWNLAESALILDAQLFTDYHVLLMLVGTVIVFVLPPLQTLIEPVQRWKTITAVVVLTLMSAGFALPSVQNQLQSGLANGLGQGNKRVFAGRNGWLFDQRELKAITGWGSLKPELNDRRARTGTAKDEIIAFAQQLKERGVPLLLIPIPMKVSLYPEFITGSDPDDSEAPLYHADQPALYEQLAKAGIDVQDITEALLQLKARHKLVFFKQDSHWTPEAMQDLARAIALHVRKKYPGLVPDDPLIVDTKAPDGHGYGDLAARLYPLPHTVLSEESTVLVSFPDIQNDSNSPIVLLGDAFTNIYDDPSLGYAQAANTHASFAQHLALYLGKHIDTIAINNGGPSSVRTEFAKRLDDEVRAKKLVIWLLPARDLMLPPSAGVVWSSVKFNEQSTPPRVLEPMVPKGR